MSRNIFTSTLLVAILVVLVAGNVQAQNDHIVTSATVVANVSITGTAPLNFGTIGSNTPGAVVLDPTVAAHHSYVGTDAGVGTFQLTGANKSKLAFTFVSTSLVGTSSSILFTPTVIGGATHADATPVTSGTPYSIDGAYYLWVGGSLPRRCRRRLRCSF